MPTPVEEGMRPIAFSMAMLRTQNSLSLPGSPSSSSPTGSFRANPTGPPTRAADDREARASPAAPACRMVSFHDGETPPNSS
jgi:hypothetical protein